MPESDLMTAATPNADPVVLEFPDNRLLIDLCGEYDRNLAEIEQKLSVQILRRGNHLVVIGEKAAADLSVALLKALYARLEAGREVGPADIDRELRMSEPGPAPPTRDGNQPEMFKGGPVEIKTRKKTVEPRTETQKAYVKGLFSNELAFGIGPAGTGKTYLAVAVGVSMFLQGHVDKIILSRPAVEAGENLGFLPGDMLEKIDPYLRPMYDALYEMLGFEKVAKLMERNVIEVAPLAYMRGRTLNEAFIVMDEAQNTTVAQMKMLLTRTGYGSKVVLTGDLSQVDLPKGTYSGLKHALTVLKGVKGIDVNKFTGKDIVRHPLVQRIVEAYEQHDRND